MRFSIRLDRAARRDEGLAQNLPAENALPTDVRTATAEEVVLERFQVEDAEKVFYGGLHVRPRMVRLRGGNVVSATLEVKARRVFASDAS